MKTVIALKNVLKITTLSNKLTEVEMEEIPEDVVKQVDDILKIVGLDEFSPLDEEPILKNDNYGKCFHGNFVISVKEQEVTCGKCNAKLSPMWVLSDVASSESQLRQRLRSLTKEVERTEEKLRCKCRSCGKMTPIGR